MSTAVKGLRITAVLYFVIYFLWDITVKFSCQYMTYKPSKLGQTDLVFGL